MSARACVAIVLVALERIVFALIFWVLVFAIPSTTPNFSSSLENFSSKCAMTLEEAVKIWTIYPVNKRGKDSASVFKTTLRRCSVCCAVSVSRVCVDDGIEFLCGRTDEEKFVDKDGKSVSESLLSPFVHAYGCKRQSERPDECVPCSLTFLEVEKLRRTWSLLFQ